MIDKSKAQQEGYQVLDSATQLSDQQAERIEQLKATLPGVVNGDGKVDINVLEGLLGQESIASRNQGYGLNFAGKGLARAMADEPTDRGLKVELGQSKDFDETGNIIIRGDNLDALKILRQNYYKTVKMIYIDPPYNTGSANFVYKDKFSDSEAGLVDKFGLNEMEVKFFDNMFGAKTHSSWLYAMYPRLKLARDLLTDDGVIFVSIDDNEQANLKIMCDEIFGEENFVTTITWRKKTGSSDSSTIATITEYILVYIRGTKTKDHFGKNENSYKIKRYRLTDKYEEARGPYYTDTLDRGGLEYSDSMNFPIECPDGTMAYPNGRKEFMNDGWTWKWGREQVQWAIKNDFIVFKKSGEKKNGWSVNYKNYLHVDNKGNPIKRSAPHKNVIVVDDYISDVLNSEAASEMDALFPSKVFSNPKPRELIKKLIGYVDSTDQTILDFFAGSGTTAHAVMDLNKGDGGNRKFVLVQWDESIDPEKSRPAYDFCTKNDLVPVISSICIERVNRAGEKIRTPKLDVGYKVFSLADRPKLMDEGDLFKLEDPRATTNDKLYNMLAASGKPLHTAIEEVEPDLLYKADEAYYVLGECKADLKDQPQVFIDGYAEISLETWLNTLGLDKSNVTILY